MLSIPSARPPLHPTVHEGTLDQLDGFRGGVDAIRSWLVLLPQRRLASVAVPSVLLVVRRALQFGPWSSLPLFCSADGLVRADEFRPRPGPRGERAPAWRLEGPEMELRALAKLDPASFVVHNNLGALYMQLRRYLEQHHPIFSVDRAHCHASPSGRPPVFCCCFMTSATMPPSFA